MTQRAQRVLIGFCIIFSALVVFSMIYLVHDTAAEVERREEFEAKQIEVIRTDQGVYVQYEISTPDGEPGRVSSPPLLLSEARPDLKSQDDPVVEKKKPKEPVMILPTELKVFFNNPMPGKKADEPKPKCPKCKIISEGGCPGKPRSSQ